MGAVFYLKLYALTVPVFFAIDSVWLGLIAGRFYRSQLGHLLRPEINWAAAVIFYLIFIAGILVFAVRPAIASDSRATAALLGALFGFFTYATYDLTNLATLRQWPLVVVVVDIVWGAVLCGIVAVLSFMISRHLN